MYVGKAKNLKNRIKSYTQTKQLQPRIKKMVETAQALKYEVLESELEALLVEAESIRTYQPPFNILLKDDKSPIYVVITQEEFPRVLKSRKNEIEKNKITGTILGPFQSTYKLNEVLKIARKIFPWCNNPGAKYQYQQKNSEKNRACFYYHLDLCPGVCMEEISAQDYQDQIKQLTLFLQGKKKSVLKSLTIAMKTASEKEKFELAQSYKQQISHIKDVTNQKYRLKPDIVLPSFGQSQAEVAILHLQKFLSQTLNFPKKYPLERIEGYDVSNIQGTNPTVSMVVFKNGFPDNKNYRIFNIKSLNTPNDYYMLQEAVARRQNHSEWGKPNLIIIDGGKGQLRSILKIWNWKEIPVIGIAKHPDRLIIPIIDNENHAKISYKIKKLSPDHPTLKMIQHIRNESHRFAQNQHKKLRIREMLGE